MVDVTPPVTATLEDATRDFEAHRKLLFSMAYNMLGSVADVEDVLQETWLAWSATERAAVDNPRAYLVRIAVNTALARLKRARRDREAYRGLWLPDPVADDSDHTIRSETASYAMMVVLEALTPLERAVFVLQEAFGYSHPEIADILGRTHESVRQLAHRAKVHIRDRRGYYRTDPATQRVATERFLDAALGGDLNALLAVLAPDVAMWTDGGGRKGTARRVVTGRDRILRLISSGFRTLAELSARIVDLNGAPAAIVRRDGAEFAALILDLDPDGTVRTIYTVVNPDKLHGLTPTTYAQS
ncbi:RNA polymerase sigma factor SigJ [Nocardia mexicana]|uniref:RNA polymerase sigma-70 factor (ECF subfamily) n=1 Tax=Nocardia mexicana TaxID=279262 RepID=A0A370H1V0_9NOCA|nr:RNA polymerase sigma factor SigJ [Nocardia mexicana]RDI49995.1 RNA polymerase sigma-70 factor (ECF subfamily) [Nocardia mexicana]